MKTKKQTVIQKRISDLQDFLKSGAIQIYFEGTWITRKDAHEWIKNLSK